MAFDGRERAVLIARCLVTFGKRGPNTCEALSLAFGAREQKKGLEE